MGAAAPPQPPPLLRPSMPAIVIVLNHLTTLHDPDTPSPIFCEAVQACWSYAFLFANGGGEGCAHPQPPPLCFNAIHASCLHHFNGFHSVPLFLTSGCICFSFSSFSTIIMFMFSFMICHHCSSFPITFFHLSSLSSFFIFIFF